MSIHSSGKEHRACQSHLWVFCARGCAPVSVVWLASLASSSSIHPTPSRGTQLEQTQVSTTLGRKQGSPGSPGS